MANSKVNVSQLSSPAITAVLQQEAASVDARSITSSPCSSVISEQEGEPAPLNRQSPFSTFPMSLNQASPSSSFSSIAFPRPDFGGCCMPDSETSSRSSLDGSFHCRETTDERREKYSRARRRRKDSSDSSKSAESGEEEAASERGSVAGGSVDGEEGGGGAHGSRKSSRNMDPPTPTHPVRPVDAPRGRLANIRRESSGLDLLGDEVAHERLVKAAAQVSSGFDEFRLDEGGSGGGGGGREAEEAGPSSSSATPSSTWLASAHRKRTASNASLSEPISILTNAFLPHSCSPSPTRMQAETHRNKQCYSPSTQQIVRANMPYSPSPSPTQSPTRNRLLRSLSPIASRSSLKRRFGAEEGGGGMMGMGAGMDGGMIPTQKRSCGGLPFVRNSTSPLVTDRSFPYPPVVSNNSGGNGSGGGSTPSGAGSGGLAPPPLPRPGGFHLPAPSSSSSSGGSSSQSFNPFIGPPLSRPRFLVDPECRRSSVDSYTSDGEGGGKAGDDPISEPGSVQMALDDSLPMDCEDSPAVVTPGSVQEGGGGGEQPEHAEPTQLPGTSGGLSLDDPPADPTPRFRSPLVSSASLPSQLPSGLAGGGGGERDADRDGRDRSGVSSGFSSGLSSGASTPRGDVTPRHDVFIEPLPSTSSAGFGLPATSAYSLPVSFGLPSALSLSGGGDDGMDTPQDPMMVDGAGRTDQRDADSVRDLPDLPPEEPGELDPPAE